MAHTTVIASCCAVIICGAASTLTGHQALAGETTQPTAAATVPLETFCQQAQQVITRTSHPFTLEHYTDFAEFARSKAIIDPPTIRQYVWYEDDAETQPAMISCKLKSADHLNLVFGEGAAGPDGLCQDMNRRTLAQVTEALGERASFEVTLDPDEDVIRSEGSDSVGPAWLSPYVMVAQTASHSLVLRSKGFRVDFADPRFQERPEEFRGIQYCHLIAPGYLARLVTGEARAGRSYGADLNAAPEREQ